MKSMLETLESRTLYSASPATVEAAAAAVAADVTALRTSLTADAATYKADTAALAADAAALPKTKANRKLIAALDRDGRADTARVTAVGTRASALVTARESRLTGDATTYLLDPSSTAARAKLSADLTGVEKAAAPLLAKAESTLTAAPAKLAGDLAALVAANPSDPALSADAAKAATDVTAIASADGPQLAQARIDLTAVLADLKS